jgi:pseudouridine-5'-phosphate glycosidase
MSYFSIGPLIFSSIVEHAINSSSPIVALESTVITHGLPHPQNQELAFEMERLIREYGAIPATIAVLDGEIHVGLTDSELERLAEEEDLRKISRRDFATALFKKESGGTTVAGTMFVAHRAGIKVFATGGIGGVHEVDRLDISSDLQALSETPMIVVCAGAKAILDLPATVEYLETMSVPVIGYGTDEFPAFYSRGSQLPVSLRLNSPQEVVDLAQTHFGLGMKSAILICQPLSPEDEIPHEKIDRAIHQARMEARTLGVQGQTLTPFLLSRLGEITGGDSLKANVTLLKNNARLAAQIASALQGNNRKKT